MMQWKNWLLRAPLLLLFAVTLAACGLGKESVLFVTKTTVGVDVDSKPPTFDVGFDRKEGTLAPVFADGAVLPQMAGFSSKLGIVNQAIGQSFATGNAAVLMTKYLTSDVGPELGNTIKSEEIEDKDKSRSSIQTGDERRRYFFATDTSFGYRVNFGMETGGFPDSLSLGYKRKEFAYVPLIETATGDAAKPIRISLPSLLATSGLSTDASSPQAANVIKTQFFATGIAASNLAALPGIRAAAAPRIMPDAREAFRIAEERGAKEAMKNLSNIDLIVEHVAPGGNYDDARLTALFEKAGISEDEQNRQTVESATSAEELRAFLGVNRPYLEPLAGAIDR